MCQEPKTDKELVAYEQAVKAYQFQVTRYNTWMNYYALFVGALFVAFYMIICYSKSCSCASCYTCCSCNYQLPSTRFLLILIAVLGIVASVCWMASLIGNCAWMNNYIKAVKKNEATFFGEEIGSGKSLVIYRRLIKNSSATTKDRRWKTCIDWIKEKLKTCLGFNCRRKFISTQKITQWFVGSVLAAWIYIFVCLLAKNSDITITSTQLIQMIQDYIIQDCKIKISIGIAFGIWVFFKIIPFFLWSDNLKGMDPED